MLANQLLINPYAKCSQSNLLSAVNEDQLTTTSHSNNEDSHVKMDVPNEMTKTGNKLDTRPEDVTHV